MRPIRQGDVILLPIKNIAGKKLSHLILAEGEVTGHSHRISQGKAELYEHEGILYLRVLTWTATLEHEEHHALDIPQGNWMVRIQREYAPQKQKSSVSIQKSNPEFRNNLISPTQKAQNLSPHPQATPKLRRVASKKNWRYVVD
jgi:hypothetical protein